MLKEQNEGSALLLYPIICNFLVEFPCTGNTITNLYELLPNTHKIIRIQDTWLQSRATLNLKCTIIKH